METKNKNSSPFRIVFISGLVAGAVFLALEMILAALTTSDGMLAPPRMIAGILVGNDAPRHSESSVAFVLISALFVHFTLSITYTGILFAFVQRIRSKSLVVLSGIAMGLLLYLINFYAFTEIFFWFENARNWMSLMGHLVFGLIAGMMISRMYTPEPEDTEPVKQHEEKKTVKEREKELV
jgi:uncharacterized membrane protein YagU involved in acid resistance